VNQRVLFLLFVARERVLLVQLHVQHLFREVLLVSIPVKVPTIAFDGAATVKREIKILKLFPRISGILAVA